jgi:hypothetical protein
VDAKIQEQEAKMRTSHFYPVLGGFAVAILLIPGKTKGSDAEELVKIHNAIIEAHKAGDVESWISHEPDELIMVSRGEVSYREKGERVKRIEDYLGRTEFYEYRDLIDPIVRVSSDGTLGWLIAQVKISGVRTNDDGSKTPIESIWAWVELYEKTDGRWIQIGNVSNHKPTDQGE